mmetsp:Transcript_70313/g.197159  ORF Transcript_70313/g.197159 Transcript_70313/m.197159 type:complete len:249 (+) Transcript_70313:160-906(+)
MRRCIPLPSKKAAWRPTEATRTCWRPLETPTVSTSGRSPLQVARPDQVPSFKSQRNHSIKLTGWRVCHGTTSRSTLLPFHRTVFTSSLREKLEASSSGPCLSANVEVATGATFGPQSRRKMIFPCESFLRIAKACATFPGAQIRSASRWERSTPMFSSLKISTMPRTNAARKRIKKTASGRWSFAMVSTVRSFKGCPTIRWGSILPVWGAIERFGSFPAKHHPSPRGKYCALPMLRELSLLRKNTRTR